MFTRCLMLTSVNYHSLDASSDKVGSGYLFREFWANDYLLEMQNVILQSGMRWFWNRTSLIIANENKAASCTLPEQKNVPSA